MYCLRASAYRLHYICLVKKLLDFGPNMVDFVHFDFVVVVAGRQVSRGEL